MTRNDYELIARAMNKAQPKPLALCMGPVAAQHERDCKSLADMLAGTNARFDKARFLAACGVKA